MRFDLRPYQRDGVTQIRDAFRARKKSVLYVLPTGGGKTVLFCYIAESTAALEKRVLILVHRRELLLQSSRSLRAAGIAHGLIAPGFSMNSHRVQVGSVQTVVRRLDRLAHPDLIIIDEGHHATASTWERIIAEYPSAKHLGVTATPCRMDGRGLGRHVGGVYDFMVEGPTIQELTDQGWLAEADVYAPPTDFTTEGMHMRMGDFDKKEMSHAVDKPVITGCAVTHYRKLAEGLPAIAFCASVIHAQHVAAQFREAGYMSTHVDGTMKEKDRDLAIQGLSTGSIDVITSCDIISEGVDVPICGCAILLRPTKSTGLFLQQVGRVLRPNPGMSSSIILDHVGNCLRHGLPHQKREWSLDSERRSSRKNDDEATVQIRQCPNCFKVHTPAPQCPQCGHIYTQNTRQIEEREGTLRKVTDSPDQIRQRRRYIASRVEQGRSETLDDLLKLAEERGHDPSWAHYVWKSREKKKQERLAR